MVAVLDSLDLMRLQSGIVIKGSVKGTDITEENGLHAN